MSDKQRRRFGFDRVTAGLLGRLWRDWVKRRWPKLVQAGAFMIVAAAATGAQPLLIERAVNQLALRDLGELGLLALAIFGLSLIKGGAGYGQAVLIQVLGLRVVKDLQTAMFAHLMRSDLAFFHDTASGRLVSRFIFDVNLLRGAVGRALTALLREVWTAIVLLGAMFYLDWRMALAVFAIFPLSIWPIFAIGRRLKGLARVVQEEQGGLSALIGEAFSAMRLIKAYRLEGYEEARTEARVSRIERLNRKLVNRRAILPAIMEVLVGFAVAAILLYGALAIVPDEGSLGRITGFLAAFFMAFAPIRSLGTIHAQMQEGLAAADRIFALLDTPLRQVDRPDARALAITAGEIRFEQVRFAYAGGAGALDGLDLVVPAGKTVALVGASGAGKTTALNLIPRFFEAQGGRVLIDGQDVTTVTLASLRGAISLVSQDVTLFNDSVRANIAFGRLDAGDAEIRAAAAAAAAHTFIEALPQGYDTVVGERGVKLSGGQKQRIAIARAILKDAPILLLDEATSALDTESERQVQEALDRLRLNRTTLVITHRLSTVLGADMIHVLDHGRVVEAGTHHQLKAEGGHYARLVRLQFREHAAEAAAEAGERARA